MLWTEITSVVTRDGKTLVGVAVRAWLKERRVLPATYASDSVVIVTSAAPKVELRTRDEVRAWLLDVQLCSKVVFAPLPVGDVQARQGARGRVTVNRNILPLRIEFARASDAVVTTREALVQGATRTVDVLIAPAPKNRELSFEIAFIGAKIRSRAAIRSVLDPDTGYRYLSRVRVAKHVNGIVNPLSDMNQSVFKLKRTPTKTKKSQVITTMTLLGLEAGTELIQVALVKPDGSIECSAVLQVDVTLAPAGVGALRIFKNTTVGDFTAADPELARVLACAANPSATVRVGVCDTGVYDDTNTGNYLASHWHAGKYFDSPVGDASDRTTKPGGLNPRHILADSPSMHGTNVAGQAVWGTPKIKLLDVMVQRGQETGLITDVAATRALTWARDQGATVVNCSKVMPFSKVGTNAFVADAATVASTLFLATGGNTSTSFPLHRNPAAPITGEIPLDFLPCAMVNTLWGGGCKRDRTPHESRGHGPAVEVMVPSDSPTVYSPKEIRRAFRVLQIDKFRRDLLGDLQGQDDNIPVQAPTIVGVLTRIQAANLVALELRDPAALNPLETAQINTLRNPVARPNPLFHEKRAYNLGRAEVDSWAYDVADNAQVLAWAQNILQLLSDLTQDVSAAGSQFVRMRIVQGGGRIALYAWLRGRLELKNIGSHCEGLRIAMVDNFDISSDDGVSFGLPVVANIAAKLKLIESDLTPNQIKRILIDTSDLDPGFESQCIAQGIVNPLRAYLAAYDKDVSSGGRLHHDFAPVKTLAIAEARRVYFTLFYMDSQGRDLFEAIRDRLKADYLALNIDLVEAEPPIRIKSEAMTYVEGRLIHGHDWKQVVPIQRHPVSYAPKHLRLILVNQCVMVDVAGFMGDGHEYAVAYDTATTIWTPEVQAQGKVTIQGAGVRRHGAADCWSCLITLNPAHTLPSNALTVNPEHIVTKFDVLKVGDGPFDERRLPSELLEVQRGSDTSALVIVTDPETNRRIVAEGRRIKMQFGVTQRIGGARKGRNIFINNSYHAGNAGSVDAASSALVLFEHEIGHALGMVPATHPAYYNNKEPARVGLPPNDVITLNGVVGYGGDGDHCARNTVDKTNADTMALGILADGKTKHTKVPVMLTDPLLANDPDSVPCVMYHTRTTVHCQSKFCDDCKGVLRGASLEGRWSWAADQ
jgi:hypothetical protein